MGESGVKQNDCIVKIDYDHDHDLQALVDASSGNRQWDKRSIYKLPACIIDRNVKAYKPQAVSFGPYHNGEDHLAPMEEHKHRALAHFLNRTNKPLQELLKCLHEGVQDLKNRYHPLHSDDDKSFLEIMVLDGCFMLEILLTNGGYEGECYDVKDPIFSKHGKVQIMPYIQRDMLMLENQLPMEVLDKLFSFVPRERGDNEEEMSVVTLIHKFYLTSTNVPVTTEQEQEKEKFFHVLDVVMKSHIQKSFQEEHKSDPESHYLTDIIRSATELKEAGIDFEESRTRSFTDISFKTVFFGGILSLPAILVDDATESKLLNMLAFERLHVGGGSNEVASYVFLMDSIIENEKDIALLHDSGIIQNAMGSAKAAADMFNSLSKDTTLDPASNLSKVHKDVHGFCKKRRNRYRAALWHNYFTSPWVIISLVAAILLFILTIVQTYYTIYPYYNPRESPEEATPSFHPPHH